MTILKCFAAFILLALPASPSFAEDTGRQAAVDVTAQLANPQHNKKTPFEAVLWLSPVNPEQAAPARPGSFTMTQKNKRFVPDLLVIPSGSTISFPNADPFYHDVFSYYSGRPFDLGLYEAGSTRSVKFSREGVSYLFCNIHPEMSAVVITLATPYYAIANARGDFVLLAVPAGDYYLHLWSSLADLDSEPAPRLVHISSETRNLGVVAAPAAKTDPVRQHKNKFGQDYPPESYTPY